MVCFLRSGSYHVIMIRLPPSTCSLAYFAATDSAVVNRGNLTPSAKENQRPSIQCGRLTSSLHPAAPLAAVEPRPPPGCS